MINKIVRNSFIFLITSFFSHQVLAYSDYILKLYIMNTNPQPISVTYSMDSGTNGWHSTFNTYDSPGTYTGPNDSYYVIPESSLGLIEFEGNPMSFLGDLKATINYFINSNIGPNGSTNVLKQAFSSNNSYLVDGYQSKLDSNQIQQNYVTGTEKITVSNFPSVGKQVAQMTGQTGAGAEFTKVFINFLMSLYTKRLTAAAMEKSIEYQGLVLVGNYYLPAPGPMPSGSYTTSCVTNSLFWHIIGKNSYALSGTCFGPNAQQVDSTLNYTNDCKPNTDVSNINGKLTCEIPGYVPKGSYTDYCSQVQFDGAILKGLCKGKYTSFNTSLDYSNNCKASSAVSIVQEGPSGISYMKCDNPVVNGGFNDSCFNVIYRTESNDPIIDASCFKNDGSMTKSKINYISKCAPNSTVSNKDGVLSCDIVKPGNECLNDYDQIQYQIKKYGWITDKNYTNATSIDIPIYNQSNKICTSNGIYYHKDKVICNWNVNDWGNTIKCNKI